MMNAQVKNTARDNMKNHLITLTVKRNGKAYEIKVTSAQAHQIIDTQNAINGVTK